MSNQGGGYPATIREVMIETSLEISDLAESMKKLVRERRRMNRASLADTVADRKLARVNQLMKEIRNAYSNESNERREPLKEKTRVDAPRQVA